jgi:Protein of unknown function (DUF2809)
MARTSPRVRSVATLAVTILLGLASRAVHVGWSVWDKSIGDVLYASAAYFVLAIAVPRARPVVVCVAAFAFSFAIELFQLTGVPIALYERHRWVRLFLGTSFAWHDVACYAIGAMLAAIVTWSSEERRS